MAPRVKWRRERQVQIQIQYRIGGRSREPRGMMTGVLGVGLERTRAGGSKELLA